MSNLNDRLEQLAELQKQNLEPLRHLNDAAFSAFERIARKNYELMGDMVEYAVAQTRSQLEPGSPQEVYARQMAEARAFAERVGARANEYMALAAQMRDGVADRDGRRGDAAPATGAARDATSEGQSPSADERDGAETAVRSRNASEETGSKQAAAKKAGSKKASAKKAGSKKASAKKASSKKASAKKAGSKRVSSAKKSASKKRGGSKR